MTTTFSGTDAGAETGSMDTGDAEPGAAVGYPYGADWGTLATYPTSTGFRKQRAVVRTSRCDVRAANAEVSNMLKIAN
jgi:hypothetical protein